MFIFLGFEFFCLMNVCKAHFETTEYEPRAHHIVTYEWLLIYAVAVPEGIAIKKNISQDSMPIHSDEKMNSNSMIRGKETRVLFI